MPAEVLGHKGVFSSRASTSGVFTWREPVKCQSVREEAGAPTTTVNNNTA